ncbi:MAG: autotransporter domain-containing protein [Sphingomonadales bacterium]
MHNINGLAVGSTNNKFQGSSRGFPRFSKIIKNLLAGTALVYPALFSFQAGATDVSNEAELIAAIESANAGTLGDTSIEFTADIALTGTLPELSANIDLTIDLQGFDLSGGSVTNILDSDSANEIELIDTVGTGTVSGTGGFRQSGADTFTISIANTFSGTSTISNGTIQIGDDAALGTGGVDLTGGALALETGILFTNSIDVGDDSFIITLDDGGPQVVELTGGLTLTSGIINFFPFDVDDEITFSGDISGAGTLAVSGQGVLILNGVNSYTGGTILNGGIIRLMNDTALGTGDVLSEIGSILQLADGVTLDNDLFLSANLVLSTLDGGIEDVTLTGDVETDDDTIASLFITDPIDAGDTITIDSVITGLGGLTTRGDGTTILTHENDFFGGTVVESGVLVLANENALLDTGEVVILDGTLDLNNFDETIGTLSGSGGVIDLNGNVLTIDQFSDETYAGDIVGLGSILKIGNGTLLLTGVNTSTGGVRIDEGAIGIEDITALGSNTITFGGEGEGFLLLGNVTLTNDVIFNADGGFGTLAGADAVIASDLNGNSNIIFSDTINSGDEITFTGGISGADFFQVDGLGTTIFSGTDKDVDVLVNSGTLRNLGVLNGDILVDPGAVLEGSGQINGDVGVDGTLYLGTPGANVNVAGDVFFFNGGDLELEITAEGAFSFLTVEGNVFIENGTTLFIEPEVGDYTVGEFTDYEIITATNGVNGEFSTLTIDNPELFGVLVYEGTFITLRIAIKNNIFRPAAVTANELNISDLLDSILVEDPATDDFQLIIDAYEGLGSTAEQQAALNDISGAGYGSIATASIASANLQISNVNRLITDARLCKTASQDYPFYDDACDAPKQKAPDGSSGVVQQAAWGTGTLWMQGYAGSATLDSGGGEFSGGGVDMGFSWWTGENTLVGLMGGYAQDSYTNLGSVDDGSSEFARVGLYTTTDFGVFYTSTVFSYSFGDVTTSRVINFGDINRVATGNFDASTLTFYGEAGLDGKVGRFRFQPFLAGSYVRYKQEEFTETGADSLNLNVQAAKVTSFQVHVGARLSTLYRDVLGGFSVMPEVRLKWRQELSGASDALTSILTLEEGPFNIFITDPGGLQSGLEAGFGLDFTKGGSIRFGLDLDYLISNDYNMVSGAARVTWIF